MSNITRHQGVVRSTGSRVFVLWRQIPDDRAHCLVVYRDSLPEVYANTVTDLVLGKGQASIDLWEVMDKVGGLDGRKMLDVLHGLGYIRKQRTCDIDMHVGNGVKYSLEALNDSLDMQSQHTDGKVKDYNPWEKQQEPADFAEKGTIVEKLLNEAAEYERLHHETLERAYNLEPGLRPQATTHELADDGLDSKSFYIELPEGITQTKAIEAVKKALQERKAAQK